MAVQGLEPRSRRRPTVAQREVGEQARDDGGRVAGAAVMRAVPGAGRRGGRRSGPGRRGERAAARTAWRPGAEQRWRGRRAGTERRAGESRPLGGTLAPARTVNSSCYSKFQLLQ
ncbi:hypothetical protein PVAP13_7NG270124 [Panicum virgatum]|uniref:Uncharacterized protein n=1 Tax=Panicum virgatum TaxID=38727 RepID=A0A8T0Q1P9_PANVG|nr:hypothetical protein PVAP13_7NG270124 [Panicum virgatum]